MCAVFHASAYVVKEKCSGSAKGSPRKISVLVLNEARTTQISGPAVARAQRKSEMCATPPSGLRRPLSGRRPADLPFVAGAAGTASVPGLLVRFVIVSPLERSSCRLWRDHRVASGEIIVSPPERSDL